MNTPSSHSDIDLLWLAFLVQDPYVSECNLHCPKPYLNPAVRKDARAISSRGFRFLWRCNEYGALSRHESAFREVEAAGFMKLRDPDASMLAFSRLNSRQARPICLVSHCSSTSPSQIARAKSVESVLSLFAHAVRLVCMLVIVGRRTLAGCSHVLRWASRQLGGEPRPETWR